MPGITGAANPALARVPALGVQGSAAESTGVGAVLADSPGRADVAAKAEEEVDAEVLVRQG